MAMPYDLREYLKIYDFLDKKETKKILTKLKKVNWGKHHFYNYIENTNLSHEDDLYVSHELVDVKKELMLKMWHFIDRYIRQDHAFCSAWYSTWNGYTDLRWNKYTVGTNMKTHCDHIHSMFDGNRKGIPTLTILGSLNDNYEGGELIFWDNDAIELKAGQIMIFPSNFMFPHEVRTVTKGERYSFVSWVW